MDEFTREWIDFAQEDLNSAKHLLTLWPVPNAIISFHCQQCAEKALKAFLVANGHEPPRTHTIKALRGACSQFDMSFAELSDCDGLTLFGVITRYPNEIAVDDALLKKALTDAQKVLTFVKEKLK